MGGAVTSLLFELRPNYGGGDEDNGREYTPGACRNSRKPMRFPHLHEMRPDSPALCPEQLRFPNQTLRSLDLLD